MHFIFTVFSIIRVVVIKIIFNKKIRIDFSYRYKYHHSIYIGNNAKCIIHAGVVARNNFTIHIGSGGYIEIGENCFFNNACSINSVKYIKIGSGTLFGENVKIYDHGHIYNRMNVPLVCSGLESESVIIGNNCWICSNTVVLKGVKIGDNSVIGANSVVYKDVPPGFILFSNGHLKKIEHKEKIN
jgi:acetyltransferase-like isoleucine patch superfamily enzyme